ncbi:DNA polymerase II [Shewanella maritima]|uniref:DNA polymerase II n=1 Tax=Shewanella maritima TaxID=2520507 RepID=UPI0037365635
MVLTRHAVTRNGQMSLHYYIKTQQKVICARVEPAEVICFCEQRFVPALEKLAIVSFRHQAVALKNFSSESISALYLKSPQQLRELVKVANDAGITLFETDIRPEQRYLIERFISLETEMQGYFAQELKEQSHLKQTNEGALTFNVTKARKSKSLSQKYPLSVVSLDFECSFSGQLYSVGLYGGIFPEVDINTVIMVGEADSDIESGIDSDCHIIWVSNEKQLIETLITWFEQYDPDVIIGWAVVGFDLALLSRRAALYKIPLTIGRNGTVMSWKVADKFRPETLNLPGRVVLDGIDWLKAAFYQFDSFSLEFVSRVLLGEGKAIEQVDNRSNEIDFLFQHDKQALARYNITDSRLVWDIFKHTQLLDFVIARSELTGLELGRVGASVAAFNHLYLPHLHRSGYVAPAFPASKGLESPGGYVMDSIPGYYKNVLVLDFKSLYPSIIRTFLIDPKGLIEGELLDNMPEKQISGFLGAKFSREGAILPKLIAELAQQREQAKQNSNDPLSQAIKIIMNSLYGVLGSTTCVFHDAKLASSITMRGHQIMKQTKVWIEAQGYKVIYGDTDSTFVWVEEAMSDESIAELGQQLAKEMTIKWQQWCRQEFKVESFLELEFESHFQQFIMPTLRGSDQGSKKRYVGAKCDKEGQLHMTFKGMEQVRSDWTPLAKRIQYEVYHRFFNDKDVVEYIKAAIEALANSVNREQLVLKKRLRRHADDYTAKSAPHVKAAKLLAHAKNNPQLLNKGTMIKYVMTTNGAQPIELEPDNIDMDYYVEKQIRPVVEPILNLIGEDFDTISVPQMRLI